MKVVYIAGPFRGETAWEVEKNIRQAEEMAYQVWMMGAACLCPHTNSRFFDGEGTARLWLDGTMEMMRRCDAVWMTPNWQISHGACEEKAEADRLMIPVFHGEKEVAQWLERNGVSIREAW